MEDRDRQLDDCFADAARSSAAAIPPAPDRRLSADRARQDAATLRTGRRGRLGLRVTEVAVCVFVAALVFALLLPWVRSRMSSGELPTAPPVIETAWASTEGHVIEFTVRYDSWDDVPEWDAPEHPRQIIRSAVDIWFQQHPALHSQTPGLPVADVSMSYMYKDQPDAKLELQVLVSLGDSEQVRDLAQAIRDTTGFADPQISSRTLYFSRQYPQLLSDEVTVRIDGQEYCFPYDFTIDEARSIARDLGSWRTSYEGRFGYGISNRFGDFVVFKVEHMAGGVLDYSVVTRQLDVDEEIRNTISSHSNTVFQLDDEDRAHPWRDPVLELIREGRFSHWTGQARAGEAESRIDVAIYYISCRLVPEDKWELLKERQQELIDRGREQLPPLTDEDWVEIEEWAAGLEEQLPADVLVETGKSWLELAREHHDDIRARMIDFETHDSEEYKSFPELTEAERTTAMQLAERLREVTRQWYADSARAVYESGPGAEINRRVRYIGEIPVSFHVTLKCNDAKFADSLRETLESAPGLVQPWEVKQSSIGHSVGTEDQPPPIIGGWSSPLISLRRPSRPMPARESVQRLSFQKVNPSAARLSNLPEVGS